MKTVSFNPEKHYIGKLCKRGHRWQGKKKTARYKGCYSCIICKYLAGKSSQKTKTGKANQRKYRLKYRQSERYFRPAKTERQRLLEAMAAARRRALRAGAAHVTYTLEQLLSKLDEFGFGCSYCGRAGLNIGIDHFTPITKGGQDRIENILPACGSCNSKKHNSDCETWFRSMPFFHQTRWNRILKHLVG